MYDREMRKDCPMRGNLGNCSPVGGFCMDAVSDEICEAVHNAYRHGYSDALLKEQGEQKQIKSPDEFKSLLLGMFDSIWDVEVDHPVFQDTVGELMEGVLQTYRQAVKWE